MSRALVAIEGHADSPAGPPAGAMFVSESCATAGVMLMLVAFTATWGHGDILTQATAEDHV